MIFYDLFIFFHFTYQPQFFLPSLLLKRDTRITLGRGIRWRLSWKDKLSVVFQLLVLVLGRKKIQAREVEFLAACGSRISSDSVTEGLFAYVPQVRDPQNLLVYHFQKYVDSFHQIFMSILPNGETPWLVPSCAFFFLHICAFVQELGHVLVPHSDHAFCLRNPVPFCCAFYTMKKLGNPSERELQYKQN